MMQWYRWSPDIRTASDSKYSGYWLGCEVSTFHILNLNATGSVCLWYATRASSDWLWNTKKKKHSWWVNSKQSYMCIHQRETNEAVEISISSFVLEPPSGDESSSPPSELNPQVLQFSLFLVVVHSFHKFPPVLQNLAIDTVIMGVLGELTDRRMV